MVQVDMEVHLGAGMLLTYRSNASIESTAALVHMTTVKFNGNIQSNVER